MILFYVLQRPIGLKFCRHNIYTFRNEAKVCRAYLLIHSTKVESIVIEFKQLGAKGVPKFLIEEGMETTRLVALVGLKEKMPS